MSETLERTTLNQLTLFAEASPARMCPLPDAGRDWLESEAAFGLSFIAFCQSLLPDGWLSKTSPVCYPATADEILPSSFAGWSNSGMACAGGFLTLNTSEFPSAAAVCSLSEVLEPDAPPKYFLSAKAAAGILRRSERRGKSLPPSLQAALEQAAQQAPEAKASSASKDGTGRGTPLVFQQNIRDEVRLMGGDGSHAGALSAQPGTKQQNYIFESRYARNGRGAPDTVAPPLKAESGQTGKGDSAPLVFQESQYGTQGYDTAGTLREGRLPYHQMNVTNTGVRRLMPVECERLMGWPDGWTDGQSDSARYRQCGNGVVGTVSEWLGRRIQEQGA